MRTTHALSLGVLAALLLPAMALAQTPNGECQGDSENPMCGAPDQSGGGGCGCGGGSILINFTDQGDSYQYADDFDDDAREDNFDNCPFAPNADQIDSDGDEVGDACDNCPNAPNADQFDINGNGLGDGCDDDADGDNVPNVDDNCPGVPNPQQARSDPGSALGDACNDDDDGDGCLDAVDNCPLKFASDCMDTGALDTTGCFADADVDGVPDHLDNCPGTPNPGQESFGGAMGAACDPDRDGDGVANHLDNCGDLPNADQIDADRDRRGDGCDNKYCYVITDEDSCLDPTAPFAVHAGKPELVSTGETTWLRVFANRDRKAIRYIWTIEEQPEGGAAEIINPRGSVSYSQEFLYFYEEGYAAEFSPRVPGTYVIRLQAELAFDDDLYPGQSVAESRVIMEVDGEPQMGCSHVATTRTTALGGLVALMLLGLAGVSRRRR